MDKVRVEVEIERDLLEEAERRGLDLEEETERGLRRRLVGALTPEERDAMAQSIAGYDRYVEENGLFGDEWRTF